ncbi:MAG: bis(5'-nucleosyl)-tetraphosphatase (symmetrical) YqeK [Coriobacteriia bacterium]|nr:bis(5'-nucleosyl)-tetraphosphatase (symmetrical) YqeK [Coriobacteriia bacterium]
MPKLKMSKLTNTIPEQLPEVPDLENPDYAAIAARALPLLKERLDDYGYAHSLYAAQTARDLAVIYAAEGVDPQDAYLAALLHDWDRGLDRETLLAEATTIGIELTPEVLAAPQILHAHTGAAQVKHIFPNTPDSIITAIRHHTVGDEDMDALDKIIYIADMIEPTRDSAIVHTLREQVGTVDLNTLFLQAYQATMLHLIHNRKVMHPRTTEVWNALIMKGMPTLDYHADNK